MSVFSVLRLPVRAGSEDALARAFAELEIFRHSEESGGFLGGRLLRPRDGGPFLVVAEWESERDYQGWLENPVRETLGSRLQALMDGEVAAGALYEEVSSRDGP
jgi:heme-degrading monooxygenase HmoA